MRQKNNLAHQRGLKCERLAYRYFQSRGYQFLKHRWRHPLGEVDLCFFHPIEEHYLLAEVKSLSGWDWFGVRWSKKQKRRFFNVAESLANQKSIEVRLAFVVVDSLNQVHVFDEWGTSGCL